MLVAALETVISLKAFFDNENINPNLEILSDITLIHFQGKLS